MDLVKDLAIVLRSVQYGERHRIVTAITEEHGCISALARNSVHSKRFGGTLDLFVAGEWHFCGRPGAELLSLRETTARRSFGGIHADLSKLSLASVFSEILLRIASSPGHERSTDLFRLHANALAAVEESSKLEAAEATRFLNCYMAKILCWNGTAPALDKCNYCERSALGHDSAAEEERVHFLINNATWACGGCSAAVEKTITSKNISLSVVREFQRLLTTPIRQLINTPALKNLQQELFDVIESLFVYHVPGFDRAPLKGLRFLGLKSNVSTQAVNRR
ncbi:MAG: DNA repair protein RecO [Bdellovibrionota bacterium]